MKRRNSPSKLEVFVSVLFWLIILALALTMTLSFCSAIRAKSAEAKLQGLPIIEPAAATLSVQMTEVNVLPVCGADEDTETEAEAEETQPEPEETEPEIVEAEPVAEEVMQPAEVAPPYPVPLDTELQSYIVRLCEEYQIAPEIVLAVIQHESNYNAAASGDGGRSHGLMQIQPQWNQERMAKLECSDLYDPWQNVTVGVDILAELIAEQDTLDMALMVYNAGLTGATTYWFSHGIYSNEYSQSVLSIAEGLKGA